LEELTGRFVNLTFWLVIATFSATFLALILSIWGDRLKVLCFKPKLEIHYNHGRPDSIKIPINWHKAVPPEKIEKHSTSVSYYFRFRVKNAGNIVAENVEVLVTKIEKQNLDKSFSKYKPFIPLNLGWSNSNSSSYLPLIQVDQEKYCDFGFILHPQQKQINDMIEFSETGNSDDESNADVCFTLSFNVKPNIIESYNLIPGTYRIEVVAFASNAKKRKCIFELYLSKNWYDELEEMFSQGFGLKII